MDNNIIVDNNKAYWNDYADFWFGTTALPQYGVKFPTEEELKLFGDVTGKKMLEICCGSGHSIKYHADRHAGELWGIDISQKQLDNAVFDASEIASKFRELGYIVEEPQLNVGLI